MTGGTGSVGWKPTAIVLHGYAMGSDGNRYVDRTHGYCPSWLRHGEGWESVMGTEWGEFGDFLNAFSLVGRLG
jgi:hypothetical protein